jgi:hypothetical protein
MLHKFRAAALIALLISNSALSQTATPSLTISAPAPSAPSPSGGTATNTSTDPASGPVQLGTKPCGAASVIQNSQNNIGVEQTRIFDDATLEQQLELNATRLASLTGLDQASLILHLGNVSGMNQSFSSLAANVQGGPTVQQTSVSAVPNTQTVQTNLSNTGTTASNGVAVPTSTNQQQIQTTSNPATNQTTTVTPSVTVPSAMPATISPAVTTGFSTQSSAVLSEQMQLAAGLETQLLEQEGALSDRMMIFTDSQGTLHKQMRPRATVGFDISPDPNRTEQDAAAVVELIVTNCEQLSEEPPAATAIIPSEKTFNVASVRNSSTSLGGGIATQFLGASATWLFGHNSYFLVQEQDTVAQVFRPDSKYCDPFKCIGVRWTFKPVSGQRIISSQRRTVAAQIAFSTSGSRQQFGQATVRTYWRHFDRKRGLLGPEIVKLGESVSSYPVLNYRLSDVKPVINSQSIEDLGTGQILVRLDGSFPTGTYIELGSTSLIDPASGLIRETGAIRFVASASDLLLKQAYLVSKSGDRVPLVIEQPFKRWPATRPIVLSTLDSTYSRLLVNYCEWKDPNAAPNIGNKEPNPLLLLLSGKAYGLTDAVVDREPLSGVPTTPCDKASPDGKIQAANATLKSLAITIPTATLTASPTVLLKSLFADSSDSFRLDLIQQNNFSPLSQSDRLVLVQQRKDGADFLLLGNRLSKVKQVDPTVTLKAVGGGNASSDTADSMIYISLTADQVQQYKFLVITRDKETPEAIAIPAVTLPTATQPSVDGTVLKNDDTAVVSGSSLGDLSKVMFKGISIPFTVAKDGKSVTLTHLKQLGVTSTASVQSLKFIFKAQSASVRMDVFTQKDQTVPR